VRILQVTSTNERRGAETFAHQLGRALQERGHVVTTAALAPAGGTSHLPFEVLGPGRTHPTTLRRLLRATRAHEVVVSHGGTSLGPVTLAAGVTGRPFVYRNIGDPAHWAGARASGLRVGLPLRRAAAVMALSESAADFIAAHYRVDPRRIHLSTNAVDPDRFQRTTPEARRRAREQLHLDRDRPVLAYVGALSPEKRPDWAVRSLSGCPEGTTLLVAGAGPMAAGLLDGFERQDDIRLLGSVDNPADVLAAADVVLLPSATEGVPAVLIEAALAGVPVVATAVGGVPDTASHLGGSVVVPPDDHDGFAQAVLAVLSGDVPAPPSREQVLDRHGIPAVTDGWERVLGQVLR